MSKSMIDVAYELMVKKKKAVVFLKLWEDVSTMMSFTPQQEEDNIAQFYSDLSLDDRFVCIGDNKWDLKSRHKFSEVVVDTDELLIEETDDDDLDYVEEEVIKEVVIEDYN